MLQEIASENTPLLSSVNKQTEKENKEKKFTAQDCNILTVCFVGVFLQCAPLL